jgi:hypothetical protein
MAIRTSAITYTRGVPKTGYNNFFFVAQANNNIPVPMHSYLRGFKFYNRNVINSSRDRWPWSK